MIDPRYCTEFDKWSNFQSIKATKLNAQVTIKNLQNMHEKSLPPTGARGRMELEYQDWPGCKAGDHTRVDQRPLTSSGVADVVEPRDGQ